jgi:NADPH2:quinone reductase
VRTGRHAGVEPLFEERVVPLRVFALTGVVDDVEVKRRRVVGQIDELGAARMRRSRVEKIDERDRCDNPATAVGTRRNGCRLEPTGQREEVIALARVQPDLVPLLIHDHEPSGHPSTVAPGSGPPRSPLGCWLVRAITIVDGHLELADRPLPEPGPDEVVVRVHGAGLNRADLMQRAGFYPPPPGVPVDIPGMEFSGVVATVGTNVSTPAVGDRVFGITGGGAQAEYVAVPAVHCASVAGHLDLIAMGGVPEVFITAHDAMVTQAHLVSGEWVLIHAIGSGVGTAALQLARALGGRVIGTARTPDKIERCRALGLEAGIVPTRTDDGALDTGALAWAIVEATDGGPNVVLDTVGGDYVIADVNAAAPKGRIVCIGTIAGGRADLPIMSMLGKRLTLIGTVLRGRDIAEKAAATDAFVRDVVPLLADERITPVVEATFPLDRADDAYALLESDTTFGKVILDCT